MNLQIIRVDGGLKVTPSPPYLLEYLKYFKRSFALQNYRRVNKFESRLLYRIDAEDGGLITLQGFFEQVTALIHKNGDIYSLDDRRTALPEIDWPRVKEIGLRDYQVGPYTDFLFKAMAGSGIVNATGGYGKTVAQMVTYAAFHNLNTIVAIPLAKVYDQTYAKFKSYFPEKHVGRVGGGYHDISTDVTVTTFQSLKNCATEKCQLLLVDEVQSTTGDKICDVLNTITPVRAFGYTATDKGLFNNADKLIKGLFGERLIYIPYEEAQQVNAVVPGLVYFVEMPNNVLVHASSPEGKISQGIKNCQPRNQLIGDICRMVPNNWQTLVFVDHIADHLVKLYGCMPRGTKFVHRESSKKKAGTFALTAKQQREVADEFSQNKFQFMIATDAFRAGVDIPNCRVVVQAAGGSSEIEILQEAFRGSRTLSDEMREDLGVDEKTHFVLIDIMDSHDSLLESMAHKRMEIYRKQGWRIKRVKSPADIDWFGFEKTLGL